MVLSDTYECPECGHIFDEQKSTQLTRTESVEDLKSASLEEECRNCGAMVRAGLVRCWNCNAFMRDDIARRYQQLSSTPQKIIYSDIPPEKRTDYLPPRVGAHAGRSQRAAGSDSDGDDQEFTMGGRVTITAPDRSDEDFSLDTDLLNNAPDVRVPEISIPNVSPAPQSQPEGSSAGVTASPSPSSDGPDKPKSTTPSTAGDVGNGADTAATNDAAAAAKEKDNDDLFSIAIKEQEETGQRRGQAKSGRKKASGPRTQIIIPCPSCNTLVRASDEQAGRNVRCPNCKKAVPIPPLAKPAVKGRKKATKKVAQAETPKIDVTWINDAWLHVFAPTSLVLKPGSMIDPHSKVDVALTDTGLFVLSFGKDAGKGSKAAAADASEGGMLAFVRDKLLSLLGRGSSDAAKAAEDLRDQWKRVREEFESTGEFKSLPNAEVRSIAKEELQELRLVQPVAKAHESMFAGVPVFGDGRIAVYLPLQNEEGQQSFLTLPLNLFRTFSDKLKSQFAIELPASENGIPETDSSEALSCFLDQSKFEAVRNLIYYQQDSAYELELVGHRCTACGITISEEARKKKKLGGANGKALAKTKCPKCSAKMGADPLYKLISKPDADNSATPSSEAAAAADSDHTQGTDTAEG